MAPAERHDDHRATDERARIAAERAALPVAERQAQEDLRIVVESMEIPVTRCSRDLRYLWVSKPYADWLGRTVGDIVGRPIIDVIGPDAFAAIRPHIDHVLGGERVEYEERIPFRGPGLRWIHAVYTPTFGASDVPDGWVAVVLDLDERRRLEEERGRLAAIVASSDDVIISKTLDGIITSWNHAAERMFGWTAEEAVGQHITLIIPDDRRAEEDEVLARIRRGQHTDHFETVRVAKGGRRVDVSITVSPVQDGAGRVVGASKIARNVSERRRMEQERARLLAREQEARHQAETLNRAKDELLATVSHELRTPLNAIFGWARLLQSSTMDEAKVARAADAIVRSASAQARLIEDLLDLSRIVTGRMRLEFELVDLNAIVDAALEAVQPAAGTKDIALMANLDRSLGKIVGAPDRLQQIVWNLVMNAVKFTPRGGRVDVSVRRADDTVEIVVADTGEGIGPDVLPHVFDPFRQEDNSSTRAHGGLGLGLTLVRQLVEVHGGRVRAESPGKALGSTFTVTLPVAASHHAVDGPGRAPEPGDPAKGSALRGVRVLIVDDDVDSLDMQATTLRDAGAEVRTAAAAIHAYEVVDAWQPDVVLTDLAMPDEDGFMLQRTLRTVFGRRGLTVPMVAVTAYGTLGDRAREAGFDRYVTKPVDPVHLTSVVADAARRVT